MITYFKYKNHKSKKLYKNFKTLSTISESLDILFIFGATSTSIILSIITGVGVNIYQYLPQVPESYHQVTKYYIR